MRIATRQVGGDPLEAVGVHLVAAARRQATRRRKRRRALTLTAALLALLAVAAGASAVAGFSTGVPVIDELLAVASGGSYLGEPGPGGASEPLPLPTTTATPKRSPS